jgi:hypothetical protein
MSILPGKDTVEEELDKLKRGCVGADISRIAYAVATNGDAGAVGIVLFGTDFADHHGVTNFLVLVDWDVVVLDDEEGIGARYSLGGLGSTGAYALAKAPQFVGIGSVPRSFEPGVSTELTVFKEFARSWVKNPKGCWAIKCLEGCAKVCKAVG